MSIPDSRAGRNPGPRPVTLNRAQVELLKKGKLFGNLFGVDPRPPATIAEKFDRAIVETRAAWLRQHPTGFTPEQVKNMIRAGISEALADQEQIREAPLAAGDGDDDPPAWTENDKRVIKVLLNANRADLLSVEGIIDRMEPGENVSPATAKATRKKLLTRGYLETPEGERSGVRLNVKGRRMAEKLSLD